MQTIWSPFRLAFIAVVPVIACSRGESQTAFADSAPSTKVAAVQPANSGTAAALRLGLSPTGNAARYRVRERLVGHDLPNDAIGETKTLTGAIEFDSKGSVIPQSLKFVVDAGTFARRHPLATLAMTAVAGMAAIGFMRPWPATGNARSGRTSRARRQTGSKSRRQPAQLRRSASGRARANA